MAEAEPIVFESYGGDDIFAVCREMQALADEKQCKVQCVSFNEFRLFARPGGDGVWLGINAFAGRLNRRDPAFAKSWHHPTDDDIVHVLTFSTAVMANGFLRAMAMEKTGGDWSKAWDIIWSYRGDRSTPVTSEEDGARGG